MKTTLESLRKQYRDNENEKKNHAERIKEREALLDGLRADAEAIATTGDEEAYLDKQEEIRKVEARLHVLKVKKPATQEITPEEVHAVWKDYAKESAKELTKRLKVYEAAREELARQYEGLVLFQNDELLTRRELAEMVGENPETYSIDAWLPNTSPSVYPSNTVIVNAADPFFFCRAGIWKNNKDDRGGNLPGYPGFDTARDIVGKHIPVDAPNFNH